MQNSFRYDISFLRVIAVFSVVFFHYQLPYFAGGFVGVDIFFVISGYLMTKIILTGFSSKSFNLLDFYKKRIARIIPALLVLILFFLIAVYFLVPTQFIAYLNSSFSSSLFYSNFYYYLNNGYFDAKSHLNFLLHTWSLSVEWQFYMLYPLLLWPVKHFAAKSKYSIINYYIISLAVISFGIMLYLIGNDESSLAFFMPYTRAWEMLLGGTAFLLEPKISLVRKSAKFLLVLAAYSCLCYFVVYADSWHWPSLYTIIPVFCTSIILAVRFDHILYKNRVIKYFGDVSYSLYLYHWPLFVLLLFFGYETSIHARVVFILISILLAMLSFHIVEKKKYLNSTRLLVGLSVTLFLVTFILAHIHPKYYFSSKLANLVFASGQYKTCDEAIEQYNATNEHFYSTSNFINHYLPNPDIISGDKKNIILLGDSHAGMFSRAVKEICVQNDIRLIQITADATFPMKDNNSSFPECKKYINYVFDSYLPNCKKNIDLVIININYSGYELKDLVRRVDVLLQFLVDNQINYLFLGQTETFLHDFPTTYYMNEKFNVSYQGSRKHREQLYALNEFLFAKLKPNYLNLLELEVLQTSAQSMPFVYDNNHLTYYGTLQYKSVVNNKILENLSNQK